MSSSASAGETASDPSISKSIRPASKAASRCAASSRPLCTSRRSASVIYELPICPTAIVQRAALADALIDGRGVQELDAKGEAAGEIKAVWRWIKRRL